MTQKELLKQYRDLVRNIRNFSAGQAALVANDDDGEDEMTIIRVAITPSSGLYKGGTFQFTLDLSDNFPYSVPTIRCLTSVYHPNIDLLDEYGDGDICMNLLDELFNPTLTLEDYVQGLLFLFYNPNVDDPLSGAFDGTVTEEEFHDNVRRSMRGETIDDSFTFDRVLPDEYKSDNEDEQEKEEEAGHQPNLTEEQQQEDVEVKMKAIDNSVTKDEATGQNLVTPCKDDTAVESMTLTPTKPTPTNNWYKAGLWLAVGVAVLTCTSIGLMKIARR